MIGLKNIRKKRNLNQQKVAMDLNISREALSYYENGKREPSLALLVAMSKYFNVSINYLYMRGISALQREDVPFSICIESSVLFLETYNRFSLHYVHMKSSVLGYISLTFQNSASSINYLFNLCQIDAVQSNANIDSISSVKIFLYVCLVDETVCHTILDADFKVLALDCVSAFLTCSK